MVSKDAASYNWVLLLPAGKVIPKIIHQIYFSKNAMPENLKNNTARLQIMNPEWEHRLYDMDRMVDFILMHYGERMLSYFLRISPKYGAVKADLFRYLMMYQCGGVYLDIKSTLSVPLNDIVKSDDHYLLSHWRNKQGEKFHDWGMHGEISFTGAGEFQQWHIIAEPGHPFLRAVIERVISNIDQYKSSTNGVGFHGVMRLASGIPYTLAIWPLLEKFPYRLVDSQFELGLVYSIFEKTWQSHNELFGDADYRYQIEPIIIGQ
ncbi:glycosyltransferase family 32 protein [Actimicrobium sp. CCI2.3]|uniref:glycosyltransferase family 32 protein n=1 Tax=Actimicrobium sp. CCI2.3 TaxID=3048616 RepID=UPI002AB387C8|nr:glycosyltransferase [Actimicrobium sp. CCI2.3]MDY7573701.1 glycosyltransferase [Actimicrobium sp. CCI2.3]MEB0021027.1 glycosyltransferase [Actimicrobium sp. CCI2.3]